METLLSFALLACPIGMGLMMWFMAKGMRKETPTQPAAAQPSVAVSVEQLRDEHRRLGTKIERLESQPAIAARRG